MSETETLQPLSGGESVEQVKEELRKSNARYEFLQGKYNAEIKEKPDELRQQIDRLSQEMQRFRAESERLRQENESLRHQSSNGNSDYLREIRENYPDIATAFDEQGKQSRAKEGEVQKMKDEISRLTGSVDQSQKSIHASNRAQFFERLSEKVSDWEEINVQQSWITWLGQRDKYSGRTRQELLDQAANELDVKRAATFFEDFKSLNKSGQEKLADQEQPDLGSRNPPPGDSAKPTYTREWITNFGNKLAMLGRERFKRDMGWTDQQIQFAERDIVVAQDEGRIR